MKRRTFFTNMAMTVSYATAAGLSAALVLDAQEAVAQDASLPTLKWRMTTSWVPILDNLLYGSQIIADRVAQMTGGKFEITVHSAGDLTSPFAVLDAVQSGSVPMGHTAANLYIDQDSTIVFSSGLPFGLTAQQQNAWLYEGGGLEMLQAVYSDRLGVIQFPAGNVSTRMGGWFNQEINTLADLRGLKMSIAGLGSRVMTRLGVEAQALYGEAIFAALQTGAIDAGEWIGPYDDERLRLNKVARFYYYPGWWEPGTTVDLFINLAAWQALPQAYQIIIQAATYEANLRVLARYNATNPMAIQRLLNNADIILLPFSGEIMQAAEETAFELYDELAAKDPDFDTIFKAWVAFRNNIQTWHGLSETTYMIYTAWSLT